MLLSMPLGSAILLSGFVAIALVCFLADKIVGSHNNETKNNFYEEAKKNSRVPDEEGDDESTQTSRNT